MAYVEVALAGLHPALALLLEVGLVSVSQKEDADGVLACAPLLVALARKVVELPSEKKRQGVAASDVNGAAVADHRLTLKMPHRFITPDTDRAQLDTGMVRPAADPTTRRCGPLASDPEANCAELLKGPFVITGSHLSRVDGTFSLAASDLMASTLRWRIDEVSVGAAFRLYVGQGEVVFVGAIEEQERCAMVRTGLRPYDAGKLDLELRRK